MNLLVVGSGGREHAIAWRLSQASNIHKVFVAPGNGGTALDPDLHNIDITDVVALREWAQLNQIALTVVGPEQPLSEGIVDEFRAHGLRIFGPTKQAAQLESSKAFSKAFMQRHHIPTASYAVFSDVELAKAYVKEQGAPIVIKADGLAAGKGVVVAMTEAEAYAAIEAMIGPGDGAQAYGITTKNGEQARVVIEEFLEGEEASFIVLVDGKNILPLATSQDHKRLLDGDLGPNTGGMGAYSPAPVVTPEIHAKVMREIIQPTIKGMLADGIQYTGFLYAGLMIGKDKKVKTLEFNCRLGDPETQPILMRLKTNLFDVLWAATEQGLDKIELDWDRRPAVGVVLAASGYPVNPRKGDVISGQNNPRQQEENNPDVKVFHAGTRLDNSVLTTSGGRVLCVTALGGSLREARKTAYQVLDTIGFAGVQYRLDIGHKAL
jgi:phosphoribosylamine--glycine ligase